MNCCCVLQYWFFIADASRPVATGDLQAQSRVRNRSDAFVEACVWMFVWRPKTAICRSVLGQVSAQQPQQQQQQRPSEPKRLARGSRRRPAARSSEANSKASSSAGGAANASTAKQAPDIDASIADLMSMSPVVVPRPAARRGVCMKRRRATVEEDASPEESDHDDLAAAGADDSTTKDKAAIQPLTLDQPLEPSPAPAQDMNEVAEQGLVEDALGSGGQGVEAQAPAAEHSNTQVLGDASGSGADAPAAADPDPDYEPTQITAAGRKKRKSGSSGTAKESPSAAAAAPLGRGKRGTRRRTAPDPAFSLSPITDTSKARSKLSIEATKALPLPPQSQQAVLMPDLFAEVQDHMQGELASGAAPPVPCLSTQHLQIAAEPIVQVEIGGPDPSSLAPVGAAQDLGPCDMKMDSEEGRNQDMRDVTDVPCDVATNFELPASNQQQREACNDEILEQVGANGEAVPVDHTNEASRAAKAPSVSDSQGQSPVQIQESAPVSAAPSVDSIVHDSEAQDTEENPPQATGTLTVSPDPVQMFQFESEPERQCDEHASKQPFSEPAPAPESDGVMPLSPKGTRVGQVVGTPFNLETPSPGLGPGFVAAAMLRDSERAVQGRVASGNAFACSEGRHASPAVHPSAQRCDLTADEIMQSDGWRNTAGTAISSPSVPADQPVGGCSDAVLELVPGGCPESDCDASLGPSNVPCAPVSGTSEPHSMTPSHDRSSAPVPTSGTMNMTMQAQPASVSGAHGVPDSYHSGPVDVIVDVIVPPKRDDMQGDAVCPSDSLQLPIDPKPEPGTAACYPSAATAAFEVQRIGVVLRSGSSHQGHAVDSQQLESPCLQPKSAGELAACSTILSRLRDWNSWTGSKALATQVCAPHIMSVSTRAFSTVAKVSSEF